MKQERIAELLRVFAIFEALSQSRGAWRLGQITDWATMSRATCDRHLKSMAEMGLLEIGESEYAGKPCRVFSISEDGRALMQVLAV